MKSSEIIDCFERSPVISAVHGKDFSKALDSPCEIIFSLKSTLSTVGEQIKLAHEANKLIFVHIDLAEGIGKDKNAIEYLASLDVDGIISTRGQLIKYAKEANLLTVQRFFALDTQGVNSMHEILSSSSPDMIEIMPGVIGKVIKKFSKIGIPLIAGGLIDTKSEVMDALKCGASAVSTGAQELWYL